MRNIMKRSPFLSTLLTGLVMLFSIISPAQAQVQDATLLRVTADFGDPRGLCVDVFGSADRARIERPVQAHTCKFGVDNRDQQLSWSGSDNDLLFLSVLDLCVEAETAELGSDLYFKACENSPLQKWQLEDTGEIKLKSNLSMCLTASADAVPPSTTPMVMPEYYYRGINLENCKDELSERQQWRWAAVDELGPATMNTLRSGMPKAIAAGIKNLGKGLNREILKGTLDLYADQAHFYDEDEFIIETDIAYGSNERQKLDVYTSKKRRYFSGAPVLIYIHGGGFTGGDKTMNPNIPKTFAAMGIIGVNATYRLAPDTQWPAGALDVGAAVKWVHENIKEYGGNPDQVFILGESAGAFHVAGYLFRPDLLPAETPAIAGAVFASGPFLVETADESEAHISYWGEDKATWGDISFAGNIKRTDIPVLMTHTEFDPVAIDKGFAFLLNEMVNVAGMNPRTRYLAGHNHISPLSAIGTQDNMFLEEVMDFIAETSLNN